MEDSSMGRRIQLVWYKKNWYHPNFFRRRLICIRQARYTCQHCSKKRGEEYIAKTGRRQKVVIQAAHVSHDPWNGRAVLRALCKQCHMSYDHAAHLQTYYRNMTKAMLNAGQLPLQW